METDAGTAPSPIPHVWYEWLTYQHDGNSAKQQDKDGNDDEAPGNQTERAVIVLFPGNDGAKVNQISQIEKQIDDVGYVGLIRLLAEPAIVGEAYSCSKAD